MALRAIFFDMGGTIETFDFTPELRIQATYGIQRILEDGGIQLNLTNQELYEIVSDGLKRYHEISIQDLNELPPLKVWKDFILQDFDVDVNQLESVAEELACYVELNYYHRELRPEIPHVLEEIQKMGLKIGLISNVNSRGQVPTNLKRYDIQNYFYPVVLSSEYGRRKPDPAIFHYAARLANVPTSECAYVGDRINRDIVGARKAGFQLAIQIQHDFNHGEYETGAIPDYVIEDMTEILDVIKREISNPPCRINRQIRGILFDAGDILYHRPDRGINFLKFIASLNLPDQENFQENKNALVQQSYRGIISQDEYRDAILQLYGITDSDQIERGKQLLDADDNGVEIFEGVRDTLLKLKSMGFLLGIITDTANSVSIKLGWFEKGGFGQVWDTFISSQELGTRKPDPNIYQAALNQMGIPSNQVVFVGHKCSELDGARAVGMKTIAFNYDHDAVADVFIDEFADLLKVDFLID